MAAPTETTSLPLPASGSLAIPLTELAVIAAWLDVLGSRGLLRVVASVAERDTVVAIDTWCRFARNLAGTSALIGLLGVTAITVSHPRAAFDGVRRVLMCAFLGMFLIVMTIALVRPEHHTNIVLVLAGIASGSLLANTYSMTAFDRGAAIEQRVVCALAMVMSLAGLAHVSFQVGTSLLGTDSGMGIARVSRNVTELMYFTIPVSLALGLLFRKPPHGAPHVGDVRTFTVARVIVSVAVAVMVTASLIWLASAMPADFNVLLYGALHLEALDMAPDTAYALLVGLSVGAGVLAVSSRYGDDRRLGLGSLLISAAGAGPRSPLTLAIMLLGIAALSLRVRRVSAGDEQPETPAPAPSEATVS
jgi:hypothetical protein